MRTTEVETSRNILVLTSAPRTPYEIVARYGTDDAGCSEDAAEDLKQLVPLHHGDALIIQCVGPGTPLLPPFAVSRTSTFNLRATIIRFVKVP